MKRIDERTVELSDPELAASDRFQKLLDRGLGVPEAAKIALGSMHWIDRSDAFIEYLSEGTCKRWGSKVVIKVEYR